MVLTLRFFTTIVAITFALATNAQHYYNFSDFTKKKNYFFFEFFKSLALLISLDDFN